MKELYKYLIVFVLGGILSFFIFNKDKKDIDVPLKFDITTPEIVKETDTIFLPEPIEIPGKKEIVIDSIYYNEYITLKDSIAKDSLFKEAITINTYNERIEDDSLKIDLYLKTRGTLLEYQAGYKIKPQTIKIDTTITVPIPTKTKFFIGGDIVLPKNNISSNVSIKPGLLMVNKKDTKAYKISYDPINKVIEGGIYFRF